jgi:hypothetical protein
VAELKLETPDEIARKFGVSREVVEKALEQAEATKEAERQKELNFDAKQILRAEQERKRQVERDRRDQERAEQERREARDMATKAHRKLYGKHVADRLDPFATYHLIKFRRSHVEALDRSFVAFTREADLDRVMQQLAIVGFDAEPVERPNVHPGSGHRRPRRGVLGVHIGQEAKSLAALDPSAEQVDAWIREHEQARRADKVARYERERAGRQEQWEKRTFGTTVSDVPDRVGNES